MAAKAIMIQGTMSNAVKFWDKAALNNFYNVKDYKLTTKTKSHVLVWK